MIRGPFVLDASLTLSWAFDDEVTPFTQSVADALETAHAVTPAVWPFEVANGLAIAMRRGRMSDGQLTEFLERLRSAPIHVEVRPALWLWQQILPLARAHHLSAYDAAYLDLAIRDGLPLATLDGDLRAAALAAGVPVLTEEG